MLHRFVHFIDDNKDTLRFCWWEEINFFAEVLRCHSAMLLYGARNSSMIHKNYPTQARKPLTMFLWEQEKKLQ